MLSYSLIYAEFDIFCILMMLMITLKTVFLSKQLLYQKLYLIMMGCALALTGADLFYELYAGDILALGIVTVYILNSIYFIASIFVSYFWFIYTENVIFDKHFLSKKAMLLISFPAVAFSVMTFFTAKTRWVFYFDETGYHRGLINVIYMIIPLLYFLGSVALAIIGYRMNPTEDTRSKLKITMGFVVIPILAVGIQSFLIGFPMVCIGSALGMLQVFLNSVALDRDFIMHQETTAKAKNDFFTNISHEIRTPINAILGMNTMILRESTEENVRDYSRHIETSGKMLLSLVNDILDTSKLEVGKMSLIPSEYEVYKVIEDMISMVHGLTRDKGLEFVVVIDRNIPSKLFGDEVRIRQIIINLLTNAIKYTDKGKITFTMKLISLVGNSVNVYVSVEDTGRGMKKEDIDIMFNPYERFNETSNCNIQGTGLGLPICQNFLLLMKSRLEVESTYGEGSKFHFVIGQEIVDATPLGEHDFMAEKDKQDEDLMPALIAQGVRILTVDDNLTNLKVFKGLLKGTGADVDACTSGLQAIDFLNKKEYDIVFLDILMPNMDGIETLHLIRDKGRDIHFDGPVVALTANAHEGTREKYLSEGFAEVLTKPIIPKELEAMIYKLLPKNKGYSLNWKSKASIK